MGGAQASRAAQPLLELGLLAARHEAGDTGDLAIAAGHVIIAEPWAAQSPPT